MEPRTVPRVTTPEDSTPFAEAAVAIHNFGGEALLRACWSALLDAGTVAEYCGGYMVDVYDALIWNSTPDDLAPLPIPILRNGLLSTDYTRDNVRDRQHFIDNGGDPAEWIDFTHEDAVRDGRATCQCVPA